MKRLLMLSLLVVVALSACTAPAATQDAADTNQQVNVTVFKEPN